MQEPKKFVLGFMFTKDRENVLLIRKEKPASIAGMWNGVGGKVEKYEGYEEAMVREFAEEVGIETRNSDWEHCLYFTGTDSSFGGGFAISVYRAFSEKVWLYRQMESEYPAVFFANSLPGNVVPNLRWMLPMLADPRVIFPLAIQQS